jgi:truncated hemoglobin YjbI
MTAFTKRIYDVAADIAGSSGHQNFHVSFFLSSPRIQTGNAYVCPQLRQRKSFPPTFPHEHLSPWGDFLLTHNNIKINDRCHPSYVVQFFWG